MEPKYPEAKVRLVGEDGNVFAVLGRAVAALRRVGADEAEVGRFCDEAASGDYDNALRTVMRWVSTS